MVESTASRAGFLSGTAAAAILMASAAAAQDVASAAAREDEAGEAEIVVTGTLIRNPEIEQSSPVTAIDAEEIALRQANVAEELLRTLPGAVPDAGSAVNNGNQGASYVNLRGLGPNRNLVLLDGMRITPAGLSGAVDLNNIPIALIERVDILTGGASTTYGADAVSGVVNFITRTDFEGIDAAVSAQTTEEGDGRVLRADLTLGANIGGERGNAVLSAGYIETDPVFQGDRDFSRVSFSPFTGAEGGFSSTAVPTRFSGVRNQAGTANGTFQFDPASGALVSPFQSFNSNEQNVFQTPFTRLNMFAAARYQLSDTLEAYMQGLFSKNEVRTIIASAGTFGASVNIPLSNPYMTAAARAQFCAFDVDPSPNGYRPRFTEAECTAAAAATNPADPAYRTVRTSVFRRFAEAGPRESEYTTTLLNYRAGLRGDITETLQFDVYGAYGESENVARSHDVATFSRLQLALLATSRDTCLGGSAGCVPVNLFGPEGSITPEQLTYLLGLTATSTVSTSLGQVRGLVSGDFGVAAPWAETPINIAAGLEYRKYRASLGSDALSQTEGEVLGANPAPADLTGGYSVKEAFGEIIAPLVEGRPLVESLQLELGARHSDYSTSGTTFAWKVGGGWEPTENVRIRGNYQKAVRSPTIGELYEPPSLTGVTLTADPCAGAAAASSAALAAICRAQGAPADMIGFIADPAFSFAQATTGGNPDLDFETAKTWTLGVVARPAFVPSLTVRLDYYNTRVSNAIVNPVPTDVLAQCFDTTFNPGLAVTPACTAIRRNPETGGLDADFSAAGIPIRLTNQGVLLTDGVDFGVDYGRNIGFAQLRLSLDGNWTNRARFQASPVSTTRECVGHYSVNCASIQPEFSFNQRTTLELGKTAVSLLWRYIDSLRYEPAAYAADVAAATDPDTGQVNPGLVVDDQYLKIGSRNYFDLSARFEPFEHLMLTVTVQNLFDSRPPLVGSGIGNVRFNSGNTYPSSYDALGRRYAVSARVRF